MLKKVCWQSKDTFETKYDLLLSSSARRPGANCISIFTVHDQLACRLSGLTNIGGANKDQGAESSKGKRKKRSVSSKETKYGCPDSFTKVTEYACFHSHTDSKGNAVPLKFDDAKAYCQTKDSRATLLYLSDAAEANKVWKWLSK